MSGNGWCGIIAGLLLAASAAAQGGTGMDRVERWELFELSLDGPREGNPFVDVALSAQFRHGDRAVEVQGFYDGGVNPIPCGMGNLLYAGDARLKIFQPLFLRDAFQERSQQHRDNIQRRIHCGR